MAGEVVADRLELPVAGVADDVAAQAITGTVTRRLAAFSATRAAVPDRAREYANPHRRHGRPR